MVVFLVLMNQSTITWIVSETRSATSGAFSFGAGDLVTSMVGYFRKSTLLCLGVLFYVAAVSFTSPLSSVHELLPRTNLTVVALVATSSTIVVLLHTFACWTMVDKERSYWTAIKEMFVGPVEEGVVGTQDKPTLVRVSCEAQHAVALWLRATLLDLGRHVTLGLLTVLAAAVIVVTSYAARCALTAIVRFGFADTFALLANGAIRRRAALALPGPKAADTTATTDGFTPA